MGVTDLTGMKTEEGGDLTELGVNWTEVGVDGLIRLDGN